VPVAPDQAREHHRGDHQGRQDQEAQAGEQRQQGDQQGRVPAGQPAQPPEQMHKREAGGEEERVFPLAPRNGEQGNGQAIGYEVGHEPAPIVALRIGEGTPQQALEVADRRVPQVVQDQQYDGNPGADDRVAQAGRDDHGPGRPPGHGPGAPVVDRDVDQPGGQQPPKDRWQ
jgi:hypothetical protein